MLAFFVKNNFFGGGRRRRGEKLIEVKEIAANVES